MTRNGDNLEVTVCGIRDMPGPVVTTVTRVVGAQLSN
jgi:hypothetical protein